MFKNQLIPIPGVHIDNTVTDTQDGFYLSYLADARNYGCETTAIVFGQMALSFILKGDHRENYEAALNSGGKAAVLDYFIENIDQAHDYGDHKSIFDPRNAHHAMDHAKTHLSEEVRDRIAAAIGVTVIKESNTPEP